MASLHFSSSTPASPRSPFLHPESLYSLDDLSDSYSVTTSVANMSVRSLTDVPEEGRSAKQDPKSYKGSYTPTLPSKPLSSTSTAAAASGSSSSSGPVAPIGPRPAASRKALSVRSLGPARVSSETLGASSGHSASKRSVSSAIPNASSSSTTGNASKSSRTVSAAPKIKNTPRLPHDKDAEPAPSTAMYWSRAPVYGSIPMRTMRAHSVTLVDTTAWLFGGCDDKESSKDIYCFDIETMQWAHPDTTGDVPPPCRAHTATLVDRKIIVFGGGQGPLYYDSVYILDTITRRWTRPKLAPGPHPASRRAHTAVLYKGKIWVFGGGNGLTALNDVWTLDVSSKVMRWEEVETTGRKPGPRGYHTANLIGNVMVVVGGSDGKECFTDVWCLNLDTRQWSSVKLSLSHRRLAHSATQVGSYLFIIGGHNSSEYGTELILFNLVSLQYESRTVLGKPPSPRGYHATILADSRLFLFGGYNGSMAFDDVHILDLAAGAYLPQVTSFNIEA